MEKFSVLMSVYAREQSAYLEEHFVACLNKLCRLLK